MNSPAVENFGGVNSIENIRNGNNGKLREREREKPIFGKTTHWS